MSQTQTPTLDEMFFTANKARIAYENSLRTTMEKKQSKLRNDRESALRNIEHTFEESRASISKACEDKTWESIRGYEKLVAELKKKYNEDGSLKTSSHTDEC